MSWISIILWVISNLPSIIRIVKMIIDLLKQEPDRAKRRELNRELVFRLKRIKSGESDHRLLFEFLESLRHRQ